MSFITKSAGYSETEELKTKFLKNVCEDIISTIRNLKIEKSNFYKDRTDTGEADDEIFIVNNNKKYYVYFIPKKMVSNCDNEYNLLYFFPDEKTVSFFKNDKINSNVISDFYIETEIKFKNIVSCLFEGYMYKISDNNYHYLITDILYINSNQDINVLQLDYISRFALLNEFFINKPELSIKNINNNINVGIHQIFSKSKKNMINIFKNNFIYKQELCCIETVNKKSFNKKSFIEPNNQIQSKLIERSDKFVDVYNVYDINTMNHDGILYIKGLVESRQMNQIFGNKSKIGEREIIKCKWNSHFNKWQPIFN